jgi:DNA-binding transcriptional MerR regulator
MPGGSGLLTIGEFARRAGLSVRALRLYDRIGLLRPAEVVEATGYRRYAGRQLYAGRLIALLRRLDMPLTDISEIIGAPAADAAGKLAGYWTGVERRLAAQRELADRLVRNLAAETPAPDGPGRCPYATSPSSTWSARCATSPRPSWAGSRRPPYG